MSKIVFNIAVGLVVGLFFVVTVGDAQAFHRGGGSCGGHGSSGGLFSRFHRGGGSDGGSYGCASCNSCGTSDCSSSCESCGNGVGCGDDVGGQAHHSNYPESAPEAPQMGDSDYHHNGTRQADRNAMPTDRNDEGSRANANGASAQEGVKSDSPHANSGDSPAANATN